MTEEHYDQREALHAVNQEREGTKGQLVERWVIRTDPDDTWESVHFARLEEQEEDGFLWDTARGICYWSGDVFLTEIAAHTKLDNRLCLLAESLNKWREERALEFEECKEKGGL